MAEILNPVRIKNELSTRLIDFSFIHSSEAAFVVQLVVVVYRMEADGRFEKLKGEVQALHEALNAFYPLIAFQHLQGQEGTAKKKAQRVVLEKDVKALGLALETLVAGDKLLVAASGFPLIREHGRTKPALVTPTGLTVTDLSRSGDVLVTWDKVTGLRFLFLEFHKKGSPWDNNEIVHNGKHMLTGLEPDTLYEFRAAWVDTDGRRSDNSAVVTVFVR